jgi:hypothetical protein
MRNLFKIIFKDIQKKATQIFRSSPKISESSIIKDSKTSLTSEIEINNTVDVYTEQNEGVTMSLTWKSIGHAFASGFSAIVKGASYIEGAVVKVEGSEQKVEQLSALVPGYGPTIVAVEQISYAGLGMLVGALHYGGAAFEKNLLDNGADQSAIDEIKALVHKFPNLIADVEAVFGKPKTGSSIAPPVPIPSNPPVTSVSGVVALPK